MSSLLYRMSQWICKHAAIVIFIWIAVLAIFGFTTFKFSNKLNNDVSIPGTEAQSALTMLSNNFPEVSGTSFQITIVAGDDTYIEVPNEETQAETSQPNQELIQKINEASAKLQNIDFVENVVNPVSEINESGADPKISKDKKAAIIQGTILENRFTITTDQKAELQSVATELDEYLEQNGGEAEIGGDLFAISMPSISITEAVGVFVALIVLFLMFGTVIAALIPIVTALVGVALSSLIVMTSTVIFQIPAVTLILSIMLGISVGIDYALFIIARHRDELMEGENIDDSISMAVATAGSAVSFAGITVIIALLGLGIVSIPFLTIMGQAAALGVLIAVCGSLTLIPAILRISNLRILNRRRRKVLKALNSKKSSQNKPVKNPSRTAKFYDAYIHAITRVPILTVIIVIVALSALAYPAKDLNLTMPDAAQLPHDTDAYKQYKLTEKYFGEGAGATILLTGQIVTSTDPLGLMKDVADEIRKVDGVESVPLATPNRAATVGIVQVIPKTSASSKETAQLVKTLRDLKSEIAEKYDYQYSVTGLTAVGIDVSAKLSNAILPFCILVVGLSFVLLMMVFRSILVPLTATLGFLLSVGGALGFTSLVFMHGKFNDLFNVSSNGAVICFMPIIVLGILFGLAMDYEVFLVSRIREHYSLTGNARESVFEGFSTAAKVVTTAAIIMFSVFIMFVPHGDSSIKPIALPLAIGVFIDAFIVRMTLIPTLLYMFNNSAWWLPKWIDKILPFFDVEGDGIRQELELADFGNGCVMARNLKLLDSNGSEFLVDNATFEVKTATHIKKDFGSARATKAVLLMIAGRLFPTSGDLKVMGFVLPIRSKDIIKRVGYIDILELQFSDVIDEIKLQTKEGAKILCINAVDAITDNPQKRQFNSALKEYAENVTVIMGTGNSTNLTGRSASSTNDLGNEFAQKPSKNNGKNPANKAHKNNKEAI